MTDTSTHPTPTSTTPAPGEGFSPPVVSPGVPPSLRRALLDMACRLADETETNTADALVSAFESFQPVLTDAFAEMLESAFGVAFPKSTPKAQAWIEEKNEERLTAREWRIQMVVEEALLLRRIKAHMVDAVDEINCELTRNAEEARKLEASK